MSGKNNQKAKARGYNAILAVLVIGILVAVNVAVSILPTTWTRFDISSTQLYSISSSTKAVVQNLNEDVTIYWISQYNQESEVISKLLDIYDSLGSHVKVEKVNPDVSPAFAKQYTDETVENNSLIVESGKRFRYIPYNSIYSIDEESSIADGSIAYNFFGEKLITTAIDYVTSEDLPKMYVLTGHGEAEFSNLFTEGLNGQNVETEEFSLISTEEIPEDADSVLINSPTSDISEKEADALKEYFANGGKLLVIKGYDNEEYPNLESLLEEYGVKVQPGYVLDTDTDHFGLGSPAVLLPDKGEHEITEELSENKDLVIAAMARGLVSDYASGKATVDALLTTSDQAFARTDTTNNDFEMSEDDVQNTYALAVAITGTENDGKMVWITSDYIMDDSIAGYSAGANSDFVMNSLSWMVGKDESISLRPKTINKTFLTITESQANLIKIIMLAIVPLTFLLMGILDVIDRRKVQ